MPTERQSFKGVQFFGDDGLMNILESNLKTWFDWAFLRAGAWTNVSRPTAGAFGGDFAVLRQVSDPSFSTGTVWESARKDWTWEVDVDHVGTDSTTYNPTSPAIIYVDGTPTAPSYISYPLGRVVFASDMSSSTIEAEYSYRNVQVYIANAIPWWQELQYRSERVDDSHFSQVSKGTWAIGSQHRIQMPCVIIEAVPRAVSSPYQLGDGSSWVEQDILVHIMAEDRYMRNNLADIMRGQFDATIWLYDPMSVISASDFPLDHNGDIVDSSQTYPALIDENTGHRWARCRFKRTNVSEVEALNSRLYEGVVRMTCEVILHD